MTPAHRILQGTHPGSGVIGAILVVLFALSITLVPIRADNDCWWHVKSGLYLLEHGRPTHDIFTYTAAEYEWHNHEWIAQSAMARVWLAGEQTRLGGWRAVILGVGLCIAMAALILYYLSGRLSGNWWIALLIAAIVVDVGRRTYYPRPPVISNVFLAAQLLLFTGVIQRWWSRHWLWALVPLFALWVNVHGAWMAGLVVLAAYAGSGVLRNPPAFARRVIPAGLQRPESPTTLFWCGLSAACLLATLANPYGYELYHLPARVMGDKALVAHLGELLPPRLIAYPVLVVYLVAMTLLLVWLAVRRVLRIDPAEWLVYLFFLWQGLNHVRHLLLFSVMLVPLTARALASLTRRVPPRWAVAFLPLALLSMGMTLRNWPEPTSYPARNAQYLADRNGYLREAYPADACDFIELVGFEGRMFNQNNFAGYLIWRFSPETHQTFSDSRFDIFGGTIWRQELLVTFAYEPEDDSSAAPAWYEILDRWDVNWIIIRDGEPINDTLREADSGWTQVADFRRARTPGTWQIYVRSIAANDALIERARRIFNAAYAAPLP